MRKIMHILFLSCLKATELIEKKLHFSLTGKEKLQLKAHKMMCSACSQFEKQSLLIEKGIAAEGKNQFTESDLTELKKSIKQLLENKK